ncbi:hypothetical protein G7Z17_g5566 [Cylindrodendrum hubeiense]|uniref:Ethyl tert-butyl ether degradation EthD n=1 Tax=Cylindrodendrum hubeiense TaxID=595255 RepID=A0A9P5H6G5_9HYPO|nr:hypothetical protein G7Z17_g5566 [Cylindrodendrum hubeiense]
MATIVIQYPSGHDFDLDYYLNKHMPLVSATWSSEGLQSWEIVTFSEGSAYQVQATLRWDSLESFEKAAAGSTATTVFGDIPSFTTAKPDLFKGVSKLKSAL